MSADAHAPVVVVGGGPVGTGLAIELGQRGIACTVVERYPEPQPVPRGQNLTQRTMEHIASWGAEQELRAARTVPRDYGIGGLTTYGTLLSGWSYDWLQRELVRPFYSADNERLPQYATEAVLRARVAELPSVEVLYGWTAQDVRQDAEGATVTVEQRDGGRRRELSASYVVGCDGSRSVVRERAGIPQTSADHDRLMVLLVFRSEQLHRLLERFPGKSFYNVLHPDLEGYWQFFGRVDLGSTWFFHAPVPAGTTAETFDAHACLSAAVGAPFDLEVEHLGFWDLRFALADTYREGRLLIAGDAAHSHPPYGGYGINSGLEDARNLGWKLAAVLQGWGGGALLDSYSAERQPVFASTADDFIDKAIRSDRDFLRAFDPARDLEAFEREWAARASGATSDVHSFEPHYEGSPVVAGPPGRPSARGGHADRARPGHHLTPLPLASGGTTHDVLGSGFTLLALGDADGTAGELQRSADELGVPLTVVRDDDPALRARYDATWVLVRPDQYVASASSEPVTDAAGLLRRVVGAP